MGQETVDGRLVGLFADPALPRTGPAMLTTPADLFRLVEYQIREGSPTIGAGLDLRKMLGIDPGPVDFYGNPLPSVGPPSIGAHEPRTLYHSDRSIVMARTASFAALLLSSLFASDAVSQARDAVPSGARIWEEDLVLPSYVVGPDQKNPRFYFGRAYQGAQGRVYPYRMQDRLTEERVDKTYRAVVLENEYIRTSILPEIGGRIFTALDKTNGYDFIYRQTVVKPALIGMLGAWISGGIEWNVFHHHRASSFSPVDYARQEIRHSSIVLGLLSVTTGQTARFEPEGRIPSSR